MHLVNAVQFLSITFLLALFCAAADACASVIIHIESLYASIYSHIADLSFNFLNVIRLFPLYVLRDSSFILIQFFVLKLDD